MPQFVLGISSERLSGQLSHPQLGPAGVKVEGFAVEVQRRSDTAGQRWSFTAEGYIVNQVVSRYSLKCVFQIN